MNTKVRILLALLWLIPTTALAQLGREDLRRIERLRPEYPFDRSGDYLWLDRWRLNAERDTLAKANSPWWQEILIGKNISLSRGWELGFDGLVDVFSTYNKYDGAWLGYEVFTARNIDLGRRLVIRSANYYTTRSEQYMGQHRMLYYYAPERTAMLVLDLGRTTHNTTHISNEEEFAERYLSPWGTNDKSRDYQKLYAGMRHSHYLSPKLRLDALALYEYRRPQEGFGGQKQQLLLGEVRLSYDFAERRASNADFPTSEQLPRGLFAPEVSIGYRQAIDPSRGRATTAFQRYGLLSLSLRSAYAFDDHRRLSWGLVGEYITNRDRMTAYDAHTLPIASALGRSLIGNTWATGESITLSKGAWIWGLLNYGGGRLALAHIPLLKRLQLDEELHARAVWTTSKDYWIEGGYSIGLGRMLRLGAFYGTDLRAQHKVALRFSLPFLFLTSRASTRY